MVGYSVERSITVNAPAHRVHGLVDDFHNWTQWSPWEDLDPALRRTYIGPDKGVGAHYAWSGNRKAGSGSMEITGSAPEAIEVTVSFLKPFKATNLTTFQLQPSGPGTEVRWVMTGEQRGPMVLFGKFVSMDRMIGPDVEKGLARLKAAAEDGA
ncbi:MAG: transcriptional regulator [Marmoricola sp.]|nr:transcriptional regulator [Marmoricola sp.]